MGYLHVLVSLTSDHPLPIGREGNGEYRGVMLASLAKVLQKSPFRRVRATGEPKLPFVVVASGDHPLAIRRPGHGTNGVVVLTKVLQQAPLGSIRSTGEPELHFVVVASGDYPLAIRRPGHGGY